MAVSSASADALKKRAIEAIDCLSSDLWDLNNKIWKNPELAYEEKFAHDELTTFLERQGFAVARSCPVDTAFVAKLSSCDVKLPTVGVICEYDALPKIGHACGHNLIAEAGAAAAVGENLFMFSFHLFGSPRISLGLKKHYLIHCWEIQWRGSRERNQGGNYISRISRSEFRVHSNWLPLLWLPSL